MILKRKWGKEREKRTTIQHPSPHPPPRRLYIGPFLRNLEDITFFLSSGTEMEYIMYRKILELDFTPA